MEVPSLETVPDKLQQKSLFCCLLAGGVAGFGVDVSLYPLDTVKTRLQAAAGFRKSGGFKGIYNGLGPAALGSAPGAALFFFTYEGAKTHLEDTSLSAPAAHCTAASFGEVAACLIRVPIENVKQKMQAGQFASMSDALTGIRRLDGPRGFFKGFSTTVMRDIPFSFLQFPLYEAFKKEWTIRQGHDTAPYQGALCGSFAGAIAATVTTPLDVAKTRLMLGADAHGVRYTTMLTTLSRVYGEAGMSGLFRGLGPRVSLISLGGLVYFGLYEYALVHLLRALR
jgi:solute carrier family 25 S-adenosylmethionine transporter 26